jgi:hypothetical protein
MTANKGIEKSTRTQVSKVNKIPLILIGLSKNPQRVIPMFPVLRKNIANESWNVRGNTPLQTHAV